MSFLKNPRSCFQIQDVALTLCGPDHMENGENILSLSTLKGRSIVLLILGTDCSTCRRLASTLSEFGRRYATVAVVGICVQTGCGEKLPEFARSSEARFPLTYCSTRELCPALGISKLMWLFYPTLVFIDSEQRLRAVFNGKHNFFTDSEANLHTVFDQLAGETAEVSHTGVSA